MLKDKFKPDKFKLALSLAQLSPSLFVIIFNVICLTINNLSGILDTTDTSFVDPCFVPYSLSELWHVVCGSKMVGKLVVIIWDCLFGTKSGEMQ